MQSLANWNWQNDGWIVVAGILCAVAAALLGNFLVLRRLSMLGDAISHAVLPGLAVAFLISGSRSSMPMFVGAVLVGVLTALLTEWIRGYGGVDEGAAMGVVFTSLFALGLILITQAADHVDLDPSCVLYGSIETIALDTWNVWGLRVPRVVVIMSFVLLINLLFVVLFFKELKLSAFDPELATSSGFNAKWMHYGTTVLVAITAVTSFESVGNILVVAMFIVPPAAAHLLTDRLSTMIWLSVGIATLSAVLGHLSAIVVPAWFGFPSTMTAGMIAVTAGSLFLLASLLAPKHGILARVLRQKSLAMRILAEDVIAWLYRVDESQRQTGTTFSEIRRALAASRIATWIVLKMQIIRGIIHYSGGGFHLTPVGKSQAQAIVRSHRLWEHYLVREAGFSVERIHNQAEQLEHFTNQTLRDRLSAETEQPATDPHGQQIPPES